MKIVSKTHGNISNQQQAGFQKLPVKHGIYAFFTTEEIKKLKLPTAEKKLLQFTITNLCQLNDTFEKICLFNIQKGLGSKFALCQSINLEKNSCLKETFKQQKKKITKHSALFDTLEKDITKSKPVELSSKNFAILSELHELKEAIELFKSSEDKLQYAIDAKKKYSKLFEDENHFNNHFVYTLNMLILLQFSITPAEVLKEKGRNLTPMEYRTKLINRCYTFANLLILGRREL